MKKKLHSLSLLILSSITLFSQQTFTNFMDADFIIPSANPSCLAISSQGVLAVGNQTNDTVFIWNSLPITGLEQPDIRLHVPGVNAPEGIAFSPDGSKLIVSYETVGIYIWNTIPTSDNQPVDVTIDGLSFFGLIVSPSGKMMLTTWSPSYQIKIWNSIPTVNNTAPDLIWGGGYYGASDSTLSNPWGMALSPDGKFLVADQGNNRVLIFDYIPVSTSDRPSVVVGQQDFNTSFGGATDSTLHMPLGVTVTVDGKMAICEYANNRVMIWDSVPTSNDASANVVLGQPDFNTNTPLYPFGYDSINNIRTAYAISTDLNGRLFLAGRNMNRVMVFGTLPSETADIEITLNSNTTNVCVLSDLYYEVKIKNLGSDSAFNIVATTALPSAFDFVSYSTTSGTYNTASGYFEIETLAPMDSAILVVNGTTNTNALGTTTSVSANIINSSAVDNDLSNNSATFNINILPNPTPSTPTVTATFGCEGSLVDVVATAPLTGTINWFLGEFDLSPSDTGLTITLAANSSSYTIYASTEDVCLSERISVPITINPLLYSTISENVCYNSSFMYIDGTISSGIIADENHISTLNSMITGCDSLVTEEITVLAEIDKTTTQTGNNITANMSGQNYKWLDCGNQNAILTTGQTYSATSTGNYSVEITTTDNCIDTSDCVTVVFESIIENSFKHNVIIYPNPSNGNFSINLFNKYDNINVTITDLQGKIIENTEISNSSLIELNKDISNGIYFIKIQSEDKIFTSKISIKK